MMLNIICIRRVVVQLIVFFCFLFCGTAFADSDYWCKEKGNPQHPLSIEKMREGELLSPEIRRNPKKAVEVIIKAFDQAQSALVGSGAGSAPSPEAEAFKRILQAQLSGQENLLAHFRFTNDPATGNPKLVWPTENMNVLYDCTNETPLALETSNPQKANIGYTAYLVVSVLGEGLQQLDGFYNERVANRAQEYERYMNNGLPMWPWELVVNSWGENYKDLLRSAPEWQWVVVRPSAGFEVIWPNQEEASIEASVGIEPVGFVKYQDSSYKNWWGVSALVTLGTDDNGAGLGGLLRYNNYSLGVVKRKDIDDVYLFFSFDLYGKVRESKTRIDEAKERLEALKQSWEK